MNRQNPPATRSRHLVLIEALEPRIAPAGLLNESKFTSVAVGGTLLLDASGAPGTFQGLTTGSGGGSGSYLLYLVSGRALVFTTDLNGNGRLDPGEITGIALGKDSLGHDPAIILFSDVNGDIVTDLAGTTGSNLTDSDHNSTNGFNGQLLTDTNIASITLRTLTASDIDTTIAGNTVAARLALTSFSIHGNIVAGGNIGAVTIDTTGAPQLAVKFNGLAGDQLYTGSNPSITGLYTGTAANGLDFHFTQNNTFTPNVEGTIQGFSEAANEHGGNISNVSAALAATTFSIGTIETGDGGTNAPGGNITNVTMHGAEGGYDIIAGNGGAGNAGGAGGSILNFTDLGSVTSQVILHTGDGGSGLLSTGGVGGTATFANPQIAAQVEVILGHGGSGFTTGGNGASFTTGTFDTPETTTPVGGKFYGTWHNIGDVGNTHPLADGTYAPEALDFNGDGFGDGVFTTNVPNQVTVVFGDGSGSLLDNLGNFNGQANATVTLKVPGVTDPVVTIGDFNGDGRPDIAVASGDPNNFGGVYIFLDQIGTARDPINSNNFTHSLVGDHPFSPAHESALPTLSDYPYGAFQTSGAVVALAAGDFNGDGITDIAYVQNVTLEAIPPVTGFQVLGVLLGDGDTVNGKAVGSGYFYANTAPPRAAASLLVTLPFLSGTDLIEATSLTNGNLPNTTTGVPAAPEVLIYAQQGAKQFSEFSVAVDPVTHVPLQLGAGVSALAGTSFALGQVDTNRNTGPTNISSVDFTLQAFTIQDVNNDGHADVVFLSKTPVNFIVSEAGDGAGGFKVATNPGGADNSGVFLGTGFTAIALTDVDANTAVSGHAGTFDGEGVLILPGIPGPYIQETLFQDADGTPDFAGNVTGRTFALGIPEQDQTVQALDTFYAIAPTAPTTANPDAEHPDSGYGILAPESTTYKDADLFIFTGANDGSTGPFEYFRYETENGYFVHAGDGGSSVTGVGGKGGIIGGTTTTLASGIGAVTFNLPQDPSYEGNVFGLAGNGGNGFGGGGIGGDVTGVVVRSAATLLTSDAQFTAGNGGSGIGGDGGRGGNLSELSIETGSVFTAGNAGSGVHGGQGGSITGNGQSVYDTANSFVTLISGFGGEGALQGGNGGTISAWDSEFINFVGTGGSLSYTTGAGGGAAGGSGGDGGSILNSSPDQTQNNLSGPLTLVTGAGGGGLSGGAGGAITNFINSATTQSALPTALTVLTGAGGVGVSGAGGAGGAITNFSSNATGLTTLSGFDALSGVGRVIAGDGGASFGATGGAGGTLTKIVATTTSTPLIVAGGAGGEGLTVGGDGGAVLNSTVDSAALQIGKLLVVAGRGGDATAAQPSDISLNGDTDVTDLAHTLLAFGNARGLAGNGGDITNLTQPVGAQTAVDLIAGNGGDTPNASTSLSATTGVGRGGSVTNVTLTGTVGALSRDTTLGAVTNPAIQPYAETDANGNTSVLSITAIVDLLANPNSLYSSLGDNASADATLTISGNVGIVSGAAGTVRNAGPARDGVNGDVTTVTAQSFLSVVAGSVTNVAPVRIVSGLTITNPDGVLGADRSPTTPFNPNGVLDYYDPTLGQDVSSLAAGDSLIDGAIFASTYSGTRGPRVFTPSTT